MEAAKDNNFQIVFVGDTDSDKPYKVFEISAAISKFLQDVDDFVIESGPNWFFCRCTHANLQACQGRPNHNEFSSAYTIYACILTFYKPK